jgi:hypothetical protein
LKNKLVRLIGVARIAPHHFRQLGVELHHGLSLRRGAEYYSVLK